MTNSKLTIFKSVLYLFFSILSIFMAINIRDFGFVAIGGWLIATIHFLDKALEYFFILHVGQMTKKQKLEAIKLVEKSIKDEKDDV